MISLNFQLKNKYNYLISGRNILFEDKIHIVSITKLSNIISNKKFSLLIYGNPTDDRDNIISTKEIFKKINELKTKKNILHYLKSLCGAFNVVIFFSKKKNFIIFRDKDGHIPIFYSKNSDKEIFISDSLLLLKKQIHLEINQEFLKKYIIYRYNFIYGNSETFYKNVNYLPAASILTISEKSHNVFRYAQSKLKTNNNIDYISAKKKIYDYSIELFNKKKLLFDKKTILALSGGLDSTSAAYFISKVDRKLPSFTAEYNDKLLINELSTAKLVSNLYSTKWLKIKISGNEFLKYWKNIYNYYSTPLPTSSSLGYHIMYEKLKQKGFNKILNVGSPDHYFLGNYPGFIYNLCDLYEKNKNEFNKQLASWIKYHGTKEFPKNYKIFKDFYNNNICKKKKYSIKPVAELVASEYIKKKKFFPFNRFTSNSYLNAYLVMAIWNSERAPGLVTFSEMSSITGVETIDPFIGEKIRKLSFSLPSSYKIRNSIGKFILRDLMKKYLPEKIVKFNGKVGYDVPFALWSNKNKKIYNFILKILNDNINNVFLRDLNMKKIIINFKKNKINKMFLWQLVNGVMWLNSFHVKK